MSVWRTRQNTAGSGTTAFWTWSFSSAGVSRHLPNILFVHYNDLKADLEGEMRRIARFLEIEVPPPSGRY